MCVAAPDKNWGYTCGEATGEWSSLTCSEHYGFISQHAGKCCSDGASFCPPPQLCAEPAAFNQAAVFDYRCIGPITADFTEQHCSAAGCWSHSMHKYCSCEQVTDSEAACLAIFAGELLRVYGVR